MNLRTILASLLCLVLFIQVASAAEPPKPSVEPTRVAVANPAKIFNDMQELKDLRAKMESDKKLLEGIDSEKRQKLRSLEEARNALKPETPQYKEKNEELLKAAIEFETWGRLNQANFQREQKMQLKIMYQKIEDAIGEIAKQKGFDLVIVDQRAELPDELDKLNMDQLRTIINSRTVLFSDPKNDISSDVLALLDQRYRGGNKPQQ